MLGSPRRLAPEWPVDTLDVDDLERTGSWRPTPFREFIVKVHSRCNLSCDYCYIYEMEDQTWRDQPTVMAPAVMAQVAARIAEHSRVHDLRAIDLTLHGGEPLLAGPERLARFVGEVRTALGPGCAMRLSIQTNGVLLDERHLPFLLEHDVAVGVSLDGGRDATNRHRRFANGNGSFAAVERGIGRLSQPRYRKLFSGLLCTIDLDNDPVETYRDLLRFAPPSMDFLLPHGNWSSPPPGRRDDGSTPYADWLIAIYDAWCESAERMTRIRIFETIMNLILTGRGGFDNIGLQPSPAVIIQTDGTVEQSDTLKSVFDGAAQTGANVWHDSFDDVLRHPGVVARQIGIQALCQTCRTCPIHTVCGAGFYGHRYRAGHGFLNPSVYCMDLAKLIRHISQHLLLDLSRRQSPRH